MTTTATLRRTARRTVVAALAVAGLAASAPVAANATTYFRSPSGNVQCASSSSYGLQCDVRSQGVTLGINRYGESFSTDTEYPIWARRAIPYGYKLVSRSFVCRSQYDNFECFSRYTGQGFRTDGFNWELF
jgi:hypothetical protein